MRVEMYKCMRQGVAKAATWPRRDCPVVVTPEPAGERAHNATQERESARSQGGSGTTGGQYDRARVSDRAVCPGVSIGQAPRLVQPSGRGAVLCCRLVEGVEPVPVGVGRGSPLLISSYIKAREGIASWHAGRYDAPIRQ